MLMFGLRLGNDPRAVVTTTPEPIKIIRELIADPTTVITRGSTLSGLGHQPRVLHRYHRLRRETLQQRNLLIGEGANFLAINRERADYRVILRGRIELALKKEFFPSIKWKIGSFPGPAVHEIVTPLSTGYTCPVTIPDSSEAKNTAMLAMSSGSISPTRCAAASFVTRGLPASSRPRTRSVIVADGAIALKLATVR